MPAARPERDADDHRRQRGGKGVDGRARASSSARASTRSRGRARQTRRVRARRAASHAHRDAGRSAHRVPRAACRRRPSRAAAAWLAVDRLRFSRSARGQRRRTAPPTQACGDADHVVPEIPDRGNQHEPAPATLQRRHRRVFIAYSAPLDSGAVVRTGREPADGHRERGAQGGRRHEHHQQAHEQRESPETAPTATVVVGPRQERREGARTSKGQRERGQRRDHDLERRVGDERLARREREAAAPPPTAAPSARPPRNAATTALAAAVVWPM